MNTCAHTWIYIGSKRQNIWRCALCDEYRIDDPTQKREWQGLTDEERRSIREHQELLKELGAVWAPMLLYYYVAIEAKLKKKNT